MSSGFTPKAAAVRRCISLASSRPRLPVEALAQPALTAIALAVSRCATSLETSTGAAHSLLVVKTAPVAAGTVLLMMVTSRLPLALIPAFTAAVTNPPGVITQPSNFFISQTSSTFFLTDKPVIVANLYFQAGQKAHSYFAPLV